jgi:hypothetical protein
VVFDTNFFFAVNVFLFLVIRTLDPDRDSYLSNDYGYEALQNTNQN